MLAHDLHPEYLSTKWALAQDGVELVGVQHHHAHLAACLAEHGEPGPVIGIACDGLGYGTDGTLWGGEVFDVSLAGFTRVAHLEPVPLPGGATAIRQPWRTAAAWLRTAGVDAARAGRADRAGVGGGPAAARLPAGPARDDQRRPAVRRGGRAVRGPGPGELRGPGGDRAGAAGRPVGARRLPGRPVRTGDRASDLVRAVVADLRRGADPAVVAARFHHGLAAALVAAAVDAARDRGRDTVALSGGVFQNQLLLAAVRRGCERAGLRVLVHSRLPCNDAGISLGQVAVAAASSRQL